MRFSPRRQAIVWGCLGTALLLFGFIRPWFVLDIAGFRFPIALLLLLYAALQFVVHLMTRNQLGLSLAEIQTYGATLEAATPRIVDLLAEGRTSGAIAKELHTDLGLPPHVTTRYILAVLKELQREQQHQLLTERPAPTAVEAPNGAPAEEPDDTPQS